MGVNVTSQSGQGMGSRGDVNTSEARQQLSTSPRPALQRRCGAHSNVSVSVGSYRGEITSRFANSLHKMPWLICNETSD